MGKPRVVETYDASNAHAKKEKTEKKRRRIHLIRRIAKLLLGSRTTKHQKKAKDSQRLGDQLEEGKTCHGPSRWHNLLPFLEPLYTLDPKLSFIEDRILGRTPMTAHDSTGIPSTSPKSLAELQHHVQEADLPCTCDECAPKLYKITTLASHGTIQDHVNHSPSTKRNNTNKPPPFTHKHTTKPPTPHLTLSFHGTYEPMTLVRHHTAWLDATYLHPSARPPPSVYHLRSLLCTWTPHLSSPDLRSSLPPTQLSTLFQHLNTVFFAGAVPAHNSLLTAGFTYLPSTQTDCFGKSFFNPLVGTQILLHPTLYRGARPLDTETQRRRARIRSRLGTLLHEMLHAFLKAYTCRACPMQDVCIGPRGHGRAWQVLARKIEGLAGLVVGGEVDLGRWQSVLRDCEGGPRERGVSVHDLEVWGMGGGGA